MNDSAMKHRILVVEDDAPARKGLEDLLIAWGYEVSAAPDGAEALERLAEEAPAVVLSDGNAIRQGLHAESNDVVYVYVADGHRETCERRYEPAELDRPAGPHLSCTAV